MGKRASRLTANLALGAGAVLLAVALPTSVVAVSLIEDGGAFSAREGFASFTPASVDPRLAEIIAERSSSGKAPLMRFTPAGSSSASAHRSVTVAVRVDQKVAQSISDRSTLEPDVRDSSVRIAPTRYNLGIARGYRGFAQAPALSRELSSAAIPDLAEFQPRTAANDEPSRFAARIELEEELPASRSAEARQRTADQLLDVGGSYRLTRNLDVTAGVRYEQDRELRPLPELEQQDSQAVYIGTQFRF